MKTLISIIVILVAVGCSNEIQMVEDANTMLQTELEKSNDKLVNNCISCCQTRTDILINYQKNNTSENKRFTIIAFDFHSNYDLNINRLNPLVNWRANASFYKDLCKLAERFTEVDIIIRGKNINYFIKKPLVQRPL